MKVFQLIKAVLDDVYQDINDFNDINDSWLWSKDDAINHAIAYLKERYKHLTDDNKPIDYSSSAIRFAYIYKYTTCHSNLVYSLIKQNCHLEKLFDASEIRATCVGGGPGSDFLGLLKYMMMSNKKPTVRCTMLDREPIWGMSWNDISSKIETSLPFHTLFQAVDVCNDIRWESYRALFRKTDLFTMVFFMSELYHFQTQSEPFFECMFQSAKPGAIFLYIDNNDSRFYNWFDQLSAKYRIAVLKTDSDPRMLLPSTIGREEKNDLGEYLERFECPKLTADVAYRICRKEC